MPASNIMEVALELLKIHSWTEQGLQLKLNQKGFKPQEIQDCLVRLKGWGYVNDREYGLQRLVLLQKRLKSQAYCEADLIHSGIPKDLVRDILQENYPNALEFTIAQQLVAKRHSAQGKNNKSEWLPLVRCGFSESTIRQCFPELSST